MEKQTAIKFRYFDERRKTFNTETLTPAFTLLFTAAVFI